MLANNLWYANRYGVWFANLTALSNLDGLLNAFLAAGGVAYRLGAAFWNHLAYGVVANLALALGYHTANGVVASLATAFSFHTAGCVVANLGTAFWNHLAYGVVANLLTAFGRHVAYSVVASLGAALWNHTANRIVAGLGAAFWNHGAYGVVANLGAALRNHTAHGVRYFTSHALAYVLGAADFLGFAGWNPNLLANGLRWALYALGAAATWGVDALAGARIIGPCAWIAYSLLYRCAWDRFGNGIPMSTSNLDGLGELNWLGNGIVFGANFVFYNFVHHRVVDRAALLLVHWLHNRVVDRTSLGFVHRNIHGVVDRAGLLLVNGLLNRVVDHSLLLFGNRNHDGVVDRLLVGFVNRLLNRVVDRASLGLVHRGLNCVVDRARSLFLNRNHHRVLNFLGVGLWNHLDRVDHLVFIVDFITATVTSLFLLFVYCFANGSHHSIRTSFGGRSNGSAVSYHATFDSAFNSTAAATTVLVADCATISSACRIASCSDRRDRQGRNYPQPFHNLVSEVFVFWIDLDAATGITPQGQPLTSFHSGLAPFGFMHAPTMRVIRGADERRGMRCKVYIVYDRSVNHVICNAKEKGVLWEDCAFNPFHP